MLKYFLAANGLFFLLLAVIIASDREWPAMIVMLLISFACFVTYRNVGGPLPGRLQLDKRNKTRAA